MTPRFNPDVNDYWMCDIGRFDYHWSRARRVLRRPMWRRGDALENAAWHDVEPDARRAAGGGLGGRRFRAVLVSAMHPPKSSSC